MNFNNETVVYFNVLMCFIAPKQWIYHGFGNILCQQHLNIVKDPQCFDLVNKYSGSVQISKTSTILVCPQHTLNTLDATY